MKSGERYLVKAHTLLMVAYNAIGDIRELPSLKDDPIRTLLDDDEMSSIQGSLYNLDKKLSGVIHSLSSDQEATELEIATKLYAKARGITIDEATDNIRDARLIREDAANGL